MGRGQEASYDWISTVAGDVIASRLAPTGFPLHVVPSSQAPQVSGMGTKKRRRNNKTPAFLQGLRFEWCRHQANGGFHLGQVFYGSGIR